jgi:LysR substrate binding domain
VTIEELARLPLIAHAPSRAHVEEHLRLQGIDVRFVLEAETGTAVQGLVAAGLGAAIVPRIAADERRSETQVVELQDGLVGPRSIAAVWSRLQPQRADAARFVEAALARPAPARDCANRCSPQQVRSAHFRSRASRSSINHDARASVLGSDPSPAVRRSRRTRAAPAPPCSRPV